MAGAEGERCLDLDADFGQLERRLDRRALYDDARPGPGVRPSRLLRNPRSAGQLLEHNLRGDGLSGERGDLRTHRGLVGTIAKMQLQRPEPIVFLYNCNRNGFAITHSESMSWSRAAELALPRSARRHGLHASG